MVIKNRHTSSFPGLRRRFQKHEKAAINTLYGCFISKLIVGDRDKYLRYEKFIFGMCVEASAVFFAGALDI